jgi:hypothetical protein
VLLTCIPRHSSQAIPVQPQESGGDYLKTLMDYIHLNPVRAKMVGSEHGLGLLDYRWSSLAQGYALLPKKRSKWLKVEEGLRIFELPDTAAGRRRFIERLEERVRKEKQKECGLPVEDMRTASERFNGKPCQTYRTSIRIA